MNSFSCPKLHGPNKSDSNLTSPLGSEHRLVSKTLFVFFKYVRRSRNTVKSPPRGLAKPTLVFVSWSFHTSSSSNQIKTDSNLTSPLGSEHRLVSKTLFVFFNSVRRSRNTVKSRLGDWRSRPLSCLCIVVFSHIFVVKSNKIRHESDKVP